MGAIEETKGCKMGAVHKTEGNGSAVNGSYRQNKTDTKGIKTGAIDKKKRFKTPVF